MHSNLQMASMPDIEATMPQAATLGLGLHRLASTLHTSRDVMSQRPTVGGVILIETSPHGSFDGMSNQFVVASNAFVPGRDGVRSLLSPGFVTNCIERAEHLASQNPSRVDIYGVWEAHGLHSDHASVTVYVGNGHYGSISWKQDGSRSPAIGSMSFPPSFPLPRIQIPQDDIAKATDDNDLSDTQVLAVLYRTLDKALRSL